MIDWQRGDHVNTVSTNLHEMSDETVRAPQTIWQEISIAQEEQPHIALMASCLHVEQKPSR